MAAIIINEKRKITFDFSAPEKEVGNTANVGSIHYL